MYRREPRAPSDDENRAKIDLQSGPDPSHPWSAESIVQCASGSDSASSSERDRAGDGSVRQIIMVRFLVATRPIDHQPNLFQFSLTLAQAMLQVNFTPRQPGPTRLTVRRLPRTVFPLLGRKAEHDLGQGLSGRNALRRMMPGPLPLGGHGLGPDFVR